MSIWTTTIESRPSAAHVTLKPTSAAVLLSKRSTVECANKGVKDIIKDIRSRRVVTKLILGHNDLGDDGCITLFDYLCSEEGRGYRIEEISLNSNNIGDRGLAAIADYLRDNHALKSLLLQGNAFRGDPEVVTRFAEALNSSSLEMLSLATNTFLSDPFISRFLPALHARHLRELHLTLLNITNRSMDPLIHYLISPHCRLRTLRLNGNSLGAHAVGQIIRAVTVSNYNLTRLEMLGNFSPVPGPGPDGVLDEREFNALAQWPAREKELKRVMERNDYLARMREKEALSLLVLARRVLLRSRRSDAESLVPQQDATSMPRLPTELKLHIMSLAAPRLSNAQCLRIFAYAADPETLPRTPSTGGGQYTCIPDPGSLPFHTSIGSCANGTCLGAGNSLQCRKEKLRRAWLEKVDCVMHEPV